MSEALQKLVDRAKSEPEFLYSLLSDPSAAIRGFDLNDRERAALTGNTAGRLGTLVDGAVLAAGCGSSKTCPDTCTATCTVTFTSIAQPRDIVAAGR